MAALQEGKLEAGSGRQGRNIDIRKGEGVPDFPCEVFRLFADRSRALRSVFQGIQEQMGLEKGQLGGDDIIPAEAFCEVVYEVHIAGEIVSCI